jgi:hypothetical protein
MQPFGYLSLPINQSLRLYPGAHNNGMHPTADTLLVINQQRLVAAGDAGR